MIAKAKLITTWSDLSKQLRRNETFLKLEFENHSPLFPMNCIEIDGWIKATNVVSPNVEISRYIRPDKILTDYKISLLKENQEKIFYLFNDNNHKLLKKCKSEDEIFGFLWKEYIIEKPQEINNLPEKYFKNNKYLKSIIKEIKNKLINNSIKNQKNNEKNLENLKKIKKLIKNRIFNEKDYENNEKIINHNYFSTSQFFENDDEENM